MGLVAYARIAVDATTAEPAEWAFAFMSIVVYIGYSTVLPLPLASLHEEDSAIHGTLDSILASTEPGAAVVRGAGVIHFTRLSLASARQCGANQLVFNIECCNI
ncbi:hypothetical protein BV898_12163 [Hypsibius exemplaris]|uniref:Uncharacterized protein n=1 Tax=Hypsibius exemplaris TaxID=2072580 RepID=A0A1W0WEI9_HYPEX|nr:hypothetical protein BV898_12163 [Hypsibius exemplaris]